MKPLDYSTITETVKAGTAFRARTRLQPAAGTGTKIFPPTYPKDKKAVYNLEKRRIEGESVDCVVLDSVQAQANRFEEALQIAVDSGVLKMPSIEVDFSKVENLIEPIQRVTGLQAPHRIADAIIRDSELDGTAFRESEKGMTFNQAHSGFATPLLELCPTALLLGIWDSTGPKGGLGAKFQRAFVSEIVGIGIESGSHKGLRSDPLNISSGIGITKTKGGEWEFAKKGAKTGKPSEVNHSNVPFEGDHGGVTMDYAEQNMVISMPALRRLEFPETATSDSTDDRNGAAREVLTCLGLVGYTLASEAGWDLRSRCLLWPESELTIEKIGQPGAEVETYSITSELALSLLKDAVDKAKKAGLPWPEKVLELKPSDNLAKLLQQSQEKHASTPEKEDA